MNTLPKAAMLLCFDIVEEAQREHDDWHSHEHLPERLAIAGFLRGSRWRALGDGVGYFVMYEVSELGVLSSPPYLERLNHPSPWTASMMPSYRGMKRGLCEIVARTGHGLGGFGLLLRFDLPRHDRAAACEGLASDLLPALAARTGVASATLFSSGLEPVLTVEQRIRGQDAGIDGALLVTGFDRSRIEDLAGTLLRPSELERHGASGIGSASFQLVHCLGDRDLAVG